MTAELAGQAELFDMAVQGPAAPTVADCADATAATSAAMSDPDASLREREAAAEAEQATYTAAQHLGLDEPEAEL